MNAYFTAQQSEKYLRVIAQDQRAVDLLRNYNPEKSNADFSLTGFVQFEFTRNEKTITLLRLLGVYGELNEQKN